VCFSWSFEIIFGGLIRNIAAFLLMKLKFWVCLLLENLTITGMADCGRHPALQGPQLVQQIQLSTHSARQGKESQSETLLNHLLIIKSLFEENLLRVLFISA
jgi:hypothetical protein